MTAYCDTRWKLFNAWCSSLRLRALEPDQQLRVNQARWALERHHQTCQTCQDHMRDMTDQARNATIPDFEDKQI